MFLFLCKIGAHCPHMGVFVNVIDLTARVGICFFFQQPYWHTKLQHTHENGIPTATFFSFKFRHTRAPWALQEFVCSRFSFLSHCCPPLVFAPRPVITTYHHLYFHASSFFDNTDLCGQRIILSRPNIINVIRVTKIKPLRNLSPGGRWSGLLKRVTGGVSMTTLLQCSLQWKS